MNPLEWMEENYVLPPSNGISGLWNAKTAPYLAEIVENFGKWYIHKIVLWCSSQIGKTETGYGCMAWVIDNRPSNMLLLMPNDELARTSAETRILPSLKRCKATEKSLIEEKEEKKSKEKMTLIKFIGGFLKISGGKSSVASKSLPIKFLFTDETDELPRTAVEQAEERTKTFENSGRKIFHSSTSDEIVSKSSNIIKLYNECDCLRGFQIKCIKCGKYTDLDFFRDIEYESYKDFRKGYDSTKFNNTQIKSQYYKTIKKNVKIRCNKCKELLNDNERKVSISNGKCVSIFGTYEDAIEVGYNIGAIYSPFTSLGAIANAWEKAKGDNISEALFYQGWLAKKYNGITKGNLSYEELKNNIIDEIPIEDKIILSTMSIDVQKDHFWFEISSWSYGNMNNYVIKVGKAETVGSIKDILDKFNIKIFSIDVKDGLRQKEMIDWSYVMMLQGYSPFPIAGDKRSITGGLWNITKNAKHGDKLDIFTINSLSYKLRFKQHLENGSSHKSEKSTYFIKGFTDELEFLNQYLAEEYKEVVNAKTNVIERQFILKQPHLDNHLWDCGVYHQFLAEKLELEYFVEE